MSATSSQRSWCAGCHRARSSASSCCSCRYEYGGMGGGAFDIYRVCERMAAIDLGLATSELATFLGSDPIRVGGTEEQKRTYLSRIARAGSPVRLRGHGARGRQRSRGVEDDRGAGRRKRDRHGLPNQRGEAVDQQRRRSGPLHGPRPRARRPELVRRRRRRRGLHARQARGQARDPAEQHRGAVPRQGLCRRRPADRWRRRPGPGTGPAGVRLHAADGGRVRSRRRLGGAGPRDRLLAQADPGRRRRYRRSRATRTS